jgi:hypothetical protein
MCTHGRRTGNGSIGLRVPLTVIKTKCAPYLSRGKPERRKELLSYDDYTIVNSYGSQYRGVVQYYLLAGDVWRFDRLRWVMETSMLKTLAAKHRSTVATMAQTFKTVVDTPHGPCVLRSQRRPLQQAATGRQVRWHPATAAETGRPAGQPPRPGHPAPQGADLAPPCGPVRVVRTTDDEGRGPSRPQTRRSRETGSTAARVGAAHGETATQTLVVCRACHDTIHTRHPAGTR